MEREGRLLLHRADARSRRLANILELPTLQALGLSLERLPQRRSAGDAEAGRDGPMATRKRGIGNTQFTESIWDVSGAVQTSGKNLHWIPFHQLEDETLSGPHKRWIKELLERQKAKG